MLRQLHARLKALERRRLDPAKPVKALLPEWLTREIRKQQNPDRCFRRADLESQPRAGVVRALRRDSA